MQNWLLMSTPMELFSLWHLSQASRVDPESIGDPAGMGGVFGIQKLYRNKKHRQIKKFKPFKRQAGMSRLRQILADER